MKKELETINTLPSLCLSSMLVLWMALLPISPARAASGQSGGQQPTEVRQADTAEGTILDEKGEPLIGVSVLVKGTQVGTVTDLDGHFRINAAPGSTLVISYIGYKSQEVKAARSLNLRLAPDEKVLDDVIVVGYGTQRVRDLTGAATNVKMDEIPDLPGASLVDALSGQVVGLSVSQSNGRPGATGSFRIRQPMSFTSSSSFNQPLIVIDDVVQVDENGEPSMNAFNMLDQSEIESMTVLKDASAAVYGARASAGVILVKTKRGKEGAPRISYSGKLDIGDAVSHAKMMSAYELGIWTNRMFNQTDIINNVTDNAYYKYSDAELQQLRTLDYNWLDEAWKTAVSQRHSVNVTGGSDRVTYFAGLNYQNQDSNLGNVQDFNKTTFRTGGEVKVFAGLKLSATVAAYTTDRTENNIQASISTGPWGNSNASRDYSILRHMPRYVPWTTQVFNAVTEAYETHFMSPWGGPRLLNTSSDSSVGSTYPVWNYFAEEASNSRRFNKSNGYNANFSLTYDVPFVKGLSLKATYALSYDNGTSTIQGDYLKLARAANTNVPDHHLLGEGTVYNFINYGTPDGTDDSKKPAVSYSKSTSRSEQMSFQISYARTFGLHDVSATAVVERGETEGDILAQQYRGIGRSYNGTSATAGTINSDGGTTYYHKYESGSLSYIGRANYKYANRYLAQFVFRSDASTKFAPENYWGFFPTGSLGWVVSEEPFFKNSSLGHVFDFLKFRYSLGKTGKDNVAAWQWLQIYNINPSTGLGFGNLGGIYTNGANINGTANRNIKWDSTIKQNFGVDFNVLDNRLSLTADYYYDKTKDLIMTVADPEQPIYIGAKLPPVNYGKKNAWGLEFSVRWNDRIGQSVLPKWGPIRYSVGMDYSVSWNKTVLGEEPTFDYPAEISAKSNWTGWRNSMGGVYGFRTWKHTSSHDGILRNQADIDAYWDYLTQLATAAGTTPKFLDITSKDRLYPGMVVYEDINGDIDTEHRTIAGPNGVISKDHGEDYVKLGNDRVHGINTRLQLQWGDFSWSAQLNTSWGGFLDYRGAQTKYNDFIWNQFSYVNDMFDPADNPDGKFPTMAAGNAYGETSDFWQVSTFRMFVRNMTFSYSLPKQLLRKVGVQALSFNITGNNLWDFHNPYPDHFINCYDGVRTDYPTLRTWTLGVNLTF